MCFELRQNRADGNDATLWAATSVAQVYSTQNMAGRRYLSYRRPSLKNYSERFGPARDKLREVPSSLDTRPFVTLRVTSTFRVVSRLNRLDAARWSSRPKRRSETTGKAKPPRDYRGMLPCFLDGRWSRLFRSMSRDLIIFRRVSDGSITSSRKPRLAAM